jgi:hypothetical protein
MKHHITVVVAEDIVNAMTKVGDMPEACMVVGGSQVITK